MTKTISRSSWMALAAAFPAVAARRTAFAQTAATIRMGAVASDTYGEPYFGIASGAFERAGLNVDVTTFPGGGAALQACAAGALDIGVGEVIQITNAVNRGIPFGIFAGAALYSSDAPATALIVAKDGPMRAPQDFEGRTVAVYSLNSLSEIATREWLLQNGADPATVKFVELPGSAMIASVLRGVIAGAMPGEPYLSEDKDDVRFFGKPYDAIAKAFALSSFYARRDWLAANADAARRLVRAIYETARWANGHHNETAPVVAKYANIDPANVRAMTRARFSTVLEPRMLQPVIAIAAKYKAVAQPIAATDLIVRIP